MPEPGAGKSVGGRQRGQKIIPILLLLFISTLIPVLLLEGVLRLFPGLISEPVLAEFPKTLRRAVAERLGLPLKQARRCIPSADRYDKGPELCLAPPDFDWIHRPDPVDRQYGAQEEILQDGNGFCNTREKAGRSRNDILFIGDSFTWCWTVQPDKTFSALLENQIGVHTYNLGFPGIGPYEYVEILKRFGFGYSPRLVVMSIYEGNDLRDGERFWKSVNERPGKGVGRGGQASDERQKGSLSESILSNSYSLSFIGAAIEAAGKRFLSENIDFRYRINVQGREITMNAANADRDEVRSARRLRQGEADPGVWREALVAFVELSRTHRFTPIVTYIPSAYTAYADSVVFEDSEVGRDVAYFSGQQRTYLAALADELAFSYVDLTPDLQRAVASGSLAYFPGNVHLTERGHALIAEALAPRLKPLVAAAGRAGK